MAIIGIDLGTTYSAASRCVRGVPEIILLDGEPTLPSVVGVQKNGKIVVGRIAKRNQEKNPQDTIVEVKRKMGEKVKVRLGQQEFSPQEISAMILKKIKELVEAELGEPVTGAVITCPAYFKDPARHATKEAGEIAGLNVLRIVNEPTAAAFAYGLGEDSEEEKLFIVYDLGGGTFDVTVIKMAGKSHLEVLGTGGDPHLGGGDFDDRIVKWMMGHMEKVPGYTATLTDEKLYALKCRLKAYAEQAKKELCGPPPRAEYQFQVPQIDTFNGKPIPFREVLTMEKFVEMISDLLENSMKWIDEAMKVPKEANYTEKHIKAILLVGGSTRVPAVRKVLEKRFPDIPLYGIERGINPDEIVAKGASMIAADADPESEEVSDAVLVDVTGHTLSVPVLKDDGTGEYLHPLIPKETPIPTSSKHTFSTLGNFQQQVNVRVYQGEGADVKGKDVDMIGEFILKLNQIKDRIPLEIGLDLDSNGILVAHATDLLTSQRVECNINYKDSAQMSKKDIEERRKSLEKTLQSTVGTTFNPLEDGPSQEAVPQKAPASQPAQPAPQSQPAGSPLDKMNPIMRRLYQKALDSFDKVPAERQEELFRLVGEIESSANAGDQAKLMALYRSLSKLMEGIA